MSLFNLYNSTTFCPEKKIRCPGGYQTSNLITASAAKIYSGPRLEKAVTRHLNQLSQQRFATSFPLLSVISFAHFEISTLTGQKLRAFTYLSPPTIRFFRPASSPSINHLASGSLHLISSPPPSYAYSLLLTSVCAYSYVLTFVCILVLILDGLPFCAPQPCRRSHRSLFSLAHAI
jgi:hypothetical protein